MSSRSAIARALGSAAAGAVLLACGARTGLTVGDGGGDAGVEEDAPYGIFPCTYGRSGLPVPVGSGATSTSFPAMDWGEGVLATAFFGQYSGASTVELCLARPEVDGLGCASRLAVPTAAVEAGPPQLAWNGEGFGLCWGPSLPGGGVGFATLDPAGVLAPPLRVVDDGFQCVGLEWAADHYVLLHLRSEGPAATVVARRLERDGATGPPLLELPVPASDHRRFRIDAERELVLAVWAADGEIRVFPLEGAETFFATTPAEPLGGISVAARGDRGGLLWAEQVGPGRVELRFALVHVDRPRISAATVVAELGAPPLELHLHPVWDGFLVGWTEPGPGLRRAVVRPLRPGEGDEMNVRAPIVIAEDLADSPRGLALADDEHVAFVGTALPDPTRGLQVHLQLLSCHR